MRAEEIPWDDVPLGELPDNAIANLLACSIGAVYEARVRRRVVAFGRSAHKALPLSARDKISMARRNGLGNYLRPDKLNVLSASLQQGLTIRQAALAAGVARATANRYAKMGSFVCKCGRKMGPDHRGWCHFRVARSERRQNFLSSGWGRVFVFGRPYQRPASVPGERVPELWPFIGKVVRDDHALVISINEAIPRGLPEDLRQEVGQEIALAVLSGQLPEEQIGSSVGVYIREVYKLYPRRWGPRSLDAPTSAEDDRPLIETLADQLSEAWDGHRSGITFRDRNGTLVDVNGEPSSLEIPPDDFVRDPRPRYHFQPKGQRTTVNHSGARVLRRRRLRSWAEAETLKRGAITRPSRWQGVYTSND